MNIEKIASVSLITILLFSTLNCSTGSSKRKEEHESRKNVMRELEYGRLLAAMIIKQHPLFEDQKATLYVNKVGKSVALFAGRSDIDYHFAILNSDSINAYAAPGGYIFITKGAIKKLRNEAELAAVLAHEIGHVNNKHIMKELPPPRSTGGFISTIAALLVARGAVVSTAFTEAVSKATELLFTKGYKKEDEFEADRSAIYYTAETGYNPGGLSNFLKRIMTFKSKNASAVVYNTHPSSSERIDRITKIINEEKFKRKGPTLEDRFKKEVGHLLK